MGRVPTTRRPGRRSRRVRHTASSGRGMSWGRRSLVQSQGCRRATEMFARSAGAADAWAVDAGLLSAAQNSTARLAVSMAPAAAPYRLGGKGSKRSVASAPCWGAPDWAQDLAARKTAWGVASGGIDSRSEGGIRVCSGDVAGDIPFAGELGLAGVLGFAADEGEGAG